MIFLQAVGSISTLGSSQRKLHDSLRAGTVPGWSVFPDVLPGGKSAPVGAVAAPLPEIPPGWEKHRSRNNQLLLAALAQIQPALDTLQNRVPPHRVGVILGTSTSGIAEGETAVAYHAQHGHVPPGYHYQQQELGDPAICLSAWLGLSGPAYTISTACSSSARAFISARRLIHAGVIDAAIVGGADSLCRMTLNGFHSLSALSLTGCRPFAANRDGIVIGEGAALFLLTREPAPVALLGCGESSDAHHMSAPHPDGRGAESALRQALAEARLSAADIGYLNLHGTATPQNDAMESAAVRRVFPDGVPCSSTKHLTGHTLGACGAVEAAICHALLTDDSLPLPAQDFSSAPRDPNFAALPLVEDRETFLGAKTVLSSNFAFGGNNACLLFGLV